MTSNVPTGVNDTEPIPYVLTTAAEQVLAARTATVLIQGVPVTVDEPHWCTVNHAAENLLYLEDLHHAGLSISLPVTQFSGDTEHVLVAQLVQWPYEGDHNHKGQPYISIDADGSGECSGYGATGALAFADQVIAHGEALRALTTKLAEVSS